MAMVLVVDSNAAFTRSLQILLEDEGRHQVCLAGSLAEARGLLARTPRITVVLTELSLPDGDGLSLAEEVGRLEGARTAIVMTADRAARQVLAELGGSPVRVLGKPVDPQELLELVAAAS